MVKGRYHFKKNKAKKRIVKNGLESFGEFGLESF